MKTILLTFLALLVTFPAFAAGKTSDTGGLKPVEAKKVCMVNNMVFDRDLIPVQVDGKTYYGCCPMCKGQLENDAAQRSAVDPVSGKTVDKATAVIGADSKGTTYYFENKKNLKKFVPAPDTPAQTNADGGMSMPMPAGK